MNTLLSVQPEVLVALKGGRPVVALESTLISHGLPWPRNVETAHALEAEVRALGAVPATVAVLGGRLQVGLAAEQVERLGRAGMAVAKVSRRDLGRVAAQGADGATTVAATMLIAAMAGIRVFATGGIGGVHRGAGESFDISADLQELAHTPVAVVCAGAKAILDLGLTLEYLETHGVPVLGYRCERLPGFYCADSDWPVDARMQDCAEVARVLRAHWALPGAGGVVIANPVPAEHALPRSAVDAAIEQALRDARARAVTGKAVTPFLLARVAELTGGQSLDSNVALLRHNARLAAQVAQALADQPSS